MILLDTSGLLAAMFADQVDHESCVEVLETTTPPLLLSPFVLAELDYLVMRNAGVDAELRLLEDVADGAYDVVEFTRADVADALATARRYRDLEVGIADASVVVLSEKYGTRDVLTLDQQHFRVVVNAQSQPFRILPADG